MTCYSICEYTGTISLRRMYEVQLYMYNNEIINKIIMMFNTLYTDKSSCKISHRWWRINDNYTIIMISITWYFNQSLLVPHTTSSSYWSSYSSQTHADMAYGYHYPNKRVIKYQTFLSPSLFIVFNYVNWKLNGQGALIGWVFPVHNQDYGLK